MAALPDAAYVYMVRCTGGQLYTGWTNHPAARLKAHQSGKGARYTRAHGAVGFAYLERCADRSAALRREAALKKLSKAEKEVLCAAWRAAACRQKVYRKRVTDAASTQNEHIVFRTVSRSVENQVPPPGT